MKKYILLIIILSMPIIVNAESVHTGTFKYMPAFENETEERYYYSDDYFKQSGKTYNEHLLGMSYSFALSTFEIRGAEYSKALLKEIGFKDISVTDMVEKPTLDTIGTVIAHKKVDGKNLIAVTIRGEKYDSEWGNNFIVGKSGNAKGFDDTSIKVRDRIINYIESNHLTNNKIWIVGYSRAGAVADLTGVYINNNLNTFSTTADDLYIYTYEAPAASLDETVYENIYTIRNKNDLIPMVYPVEWNFHTNGQIITLGEDKKIMSYIGLEEESENQEIEMNSFYNQFFSWLTSRLDRETYADNLEEPISKLFDIYFSKSDEDREKLKKFVTDDLKGEILDNQDNFGKIKSLAWGACGHKSDYIYDSIIDIIKESMDSVRNTPNGSVLTDEEYNIIKNSLTPVLKTLGPIIVDDVNYYDGINYDEYYVNDAPDYYLTDEELGIKSGTAEGYDVGYDDALYDNPKNEYSYDESDRGYGPIYYDAYKESYIEAYLEGYDFGLYHKANPAARGKYDGAKYSYTIGYYAGISGEEFDSFDYDFYQEEWMTEEYINAYYEGYAEEYAKGYNDALYNPVPEEEYPDQKNLYHFRTLFKNVSIIMKEHHPQENLKLIHNADSYYTAYNLTEGNNQITNIDDGENDNLTFKTSGHLEKLVKVYVDNNELKEDDYILENGSTIITLKDSYVKKLSPGTHTLKLQYIDNTIEAQFKVEGKTTNSDTNTNKIKQPNTYDNISHHIIILLIGIIGLTSTLLVKRSRV